MREIYKKYKERFIEISGKNRNLFTKKITPKINYDLGKNVRRNEKDFFQFLWRITDEYVFLSKRDSDKPNSVSAAAADFHKEIFAVRELKKEVEDIQRETGKYDLYIGFPYVCGKTKQGSPVKAPLLLFPVELFIDIGRAYVKATSDNPVLINRVLLTAVARENSVAVPGISDFFPEEKNYFDSIAEIVETLNDYGFSVKTSKTNKIVPFDDDLPTGNLKIKNCAILGRFSFSNPIYDDYSELERKNLSSPNIDLLIKGKIPHDKRQKTAPISYNIDALDFTQSKVVGKTDYVSDMVIYGPPGTGKSQTIANIIGNALCKNNRVLVVSQKQAALDVVFSRLGKLNSKAMLLPDVERDKTLFYDRLCKAHEKKAPTDTESLKIKFRELSKSVDKEKSLLENIHATLFSDTGFGLCLQKMYEKSYNIGKNSTDYNLYVKLKNTEIIRGNYSDIAESVKYIKDKKLVPTYLGYKNSIKNNPLIRHLKEDSDLHCVRECRTLLEKLSSKPPKPFDFNENEYGRYLTAFFPKSYKNSSFDVRDVAEVIMKAERREIYNARKLCFLPCFLPIMPFIVYKYGKAKKDVISKLLIIMQKLEEATKECALLQSIFDEDGYAMIVQNVLNGNATFIKRLSSALKNYVLLRDINVAVSELSPLIKLILEFCYENSSKTEQSFAYLVDKISTLRIYHEIVANERENGKELKDIMFFDSIRERINALESEQTKVAREIAESKRETEYADFLKNTKHAKEYLYQMQKTRNAWNVGRFMNYFGEYVLRLFPCWLLSPQNVSAIFPLKRNIFDIVIFDEASQIFIENALPSIYRSKTVIVAGDNKQLRPSAGFMKRYQGDEVPPDADLPIQAALEATSLLDLAETKYLPVRLEFHYRSDFSELIDFSNAAFYDNGLQIAPNVVLNKSNPPIQRIKVNGTWENRRNLAEAAAIVDLIKKIISERKHDESIGVVAFNSEQKDCLEETLDSEAEKSVTFSKLLYKERNRFENGENRSLFVKNLENVQGDERDIIIFSIGYAKNSCGKMNFLFGSLSAEGGENRLNVAITRAKKKIYVVTSIEPEELTKAESSKNNGPRLLKKYLIYARAVSEGNAEEVKSTLRSLSEKSEYDVSTELSKAVETKLVRAGYVVYRNVGNSNYRIPLAVYDEALQRYVVGIDFDYSENISDENPVESYISRLNFFEIKGWKIIRVWSRDWWNSPSKVLDDLIADIEREKRRLENEAS